MEGGKRRTAEHHQCQARPHQGQWHDLHCCYYRDKSVLTVTISTNKRPESGLGHQWLGGNNCKNKTVKDDPEAEAQEKNKCKSLPQKLILPYHFCNFIACYQPERGIKHLKEYNQARPSGYFQKFCFLLYIPFMHFYKEHTLIFVSEEIKTCTFMPIKILYQTKFQNPMKMLNAKKVKNQVINSLKINFMK